MGKLIDDILNFDINPTIIEKWNNLSKFILDARNNNGCTVQKLDVATADKYRGDFFGLLINEYQMSLEYLYPHLIVNNMSSPLDFKGTETQIWILKNDTALQFYDLVKK